MDKLCDSGQILSALWAPVSLAINKLIQETPLIQLSAVKIYDSK